MLKVGILSDTHGHFNKALYSFFKDCDEIWHAGDWGGNGVMEEIISFKPVRGVYGNIDGRDVRQTFGSIADFRVENVRVGIFHWGGYPGKYHPEARKWLNENKPDIYITGHSHILRVMKDPRRNLMFFNPGAAGNSGFHKVCTALRLKIDGARLFDLEVWESPRKSLEATI